MKVLNQLLQKRVLGLALVPLTVLLTVGTAQAGLVVSEWFHGDWDCLIDGRPARMQWRVRSVPQYDCGEDICTTATTVRVVGRFSDNGSAWVPLTKRYSRGRDFGIRYQGAEPDNWFLRYDSQSQSASGWTTWRGNRYPLQCQKR